MKTNRVCLLIWLSLALAASAADTGRGVTVEPVSAVAPGGNAGLFVGVNQFSVDHELRPLNFAVNDAIAQAHLFCLELKLIPPGNCHLALAGEPTTDSTKAQLAALRQAGIARTDASKAQILRALLSLSAVGHDTADLLVVSISSHGFEERGQPYTIPSDGLRGALEDTGLSIRTVEQRLQDSRAGKRLLLIDACRERPATDTRGVEQAMTSAFRAALAAAEGQATLASCDAGQLSLENTDLGHGVFTHFLLEALRGKATADTRGFITLGAVSDYVARAVNDWVMRNKPNVDRNAAQRPWFKGPLDAKQIPLAVDPGVRARLGAFKAAIAQAVDALKPKINRTGPFTMAVYDRLADALDKAQDEETGRKLLQWSQDFVSGKITEDVFVAYLDKTLETAEQRTARLGREAAEREVRERTARIAAFKAAIAQTVDALKPKISRTSSFTTAIYDRLTEALEKAEDNDAGRKLLQHSQDFASGKMDADIFAAYLDKTLETPEQRQARERNEKMAALLAKAQANDNKENGKTALAALDELLQLDLGNTVAQALRKKIARYYGPQVGDTKALDLGRGVKMELIWISPGEFMMGSNYHESEMPVHRVKLTKGFWMGKYEVTQEQYEAVMGSNPSKFKGANNPVEQVSWDDAAAFCRKAGGRLPTEAEWEYACRAGTTTQYYSGDAENDLARVGWYSGNSGSKTHPVGGKPANGWGLHDMHGNVSEWCADWYGSYSNNDETNPTGPASGQARMLRGLSWLEDAYLCRSTGRARFSPGQRLCYNGFRLCVDFP